ncbi:MAG: YwaF family protein [Erysipelotrichaceae bacterium]|nr:YwaF family protein [Erysipelotrichaceae bacterium]
MLKEKLIISPFNPVFFLVTGFFLLLLSVISFLVKGKSEKVKKTVFVMICLFTCVCFFLYKYALSLDPEFDRLTAYIGGYNWWGELPFHLCNVNMILMPIAVLGDYRPLKSFCFFIGPLGAAMALLMPGAGFDHAYLFLPRIIGFYGTHFMIVIEALMLMTFGFYQPAYRDIPKAMVILVLLGLIMHGLNLLFRYSGLNSRSNFFYTMETEENPILELLYSLIPCPLIYLLPVLPIPALYMCFIVWLYHLFMGNKKGSA